MDLIASSAKAALSGSIWPSYRVQRAGNSRVTHHVGHSRNTNNNIPTFLRLNSVGEVSSDDQQSSHSSTNNKMTPKVSFSEASPGKPGIMDTFVAFIPFGAGLFNLKQTSYKMGEKRSTGMLDEILSEQLTREAQMPFQSTSSTTTKTKAFPFTDCKMKKFPSWIDTSFQQPLTVNSFNQSLLESNCTRDMDSPWNNFYTQWKKMEGQSFPGTAKDCTNQTTSNFNDLVTCKRGLKRLLADAIQPEADITYDLNSRLQDLSIHDNRKLKKSEESDIENVKMANTKCERSVADITIDSCLSSANTDKQNMDQGNLKCASSPGCISKTSKLVAKANLSIRIGNQPQSICSCNKDNDLCIHYSILCDKDDKNAHNSEVQTGQSGAKLNVCGNSNMSNGSLMSMKEKCRKQKRSRPSSKKRRRQKARQDSSYNINPLVSPEAGIPLQCQQIKKKCKFEKTDSNSQSTTGCADQSISAKTSANKDGNAKPETLIPVSFILGGPGDFGSYQFSVLTDEESAFSEEDDDCDNFDISYHYDILPCSGDLFNPLNFTMSISVSPSTPEFGPKSPSQSLASQLDVINASWRVYCDNSEFKPRSSKKVSFAAENELASVYPMIAWSYAYRSARKGPWEEYARDRQRFQRRIDEADCLLSQILRPDHRTVVYERNQTLLNSPH